MAFISLSVLNISFKQASGFCLFFCLFLFFRLTENREFSRVWFFLTDFQALGKVSQKSCMKSEKVDLFIVGCGVCATRLCFTVTPEARGALMTQQDVRSNFSACLLHSHCVNAFKPNTQLSQMRLVFWNNTDVLTS